MAVRFVVKALRKDDPEGWARLSKLGRHRIGKRQGEKIAVKSGKYRKAGLEIHQGLRGDSGNLWFASDLRLSRPWGSVTAIRS